MASSIEVSKLHFMLFPFKAHGYMIPTLDLAKLFATKGAKSTIITTPIDSKLFEEPIKSFNHENPKLEDVTVEIINYSCIHLFPYKESEDTSYTGSYMSTSPYLCKGQFEHLLETKKPDCLVGTMFLPWAIKVADKFGVPILAFHDSFNLSLWVSDSIPEEVPKFITYRIPELTETVSWFERGPLDRETRFLKELKESEKNSFGVLVDSYYEFDPVFADFFKSYVAKRAWSIGPLSLLNRCLKEETERGYKGSFDEREILKWLDSKSSDSVIYVSFGTLTNFNNEQLIEIASGLEMSGHDFVWVVNKSGTQEEKEEWLPEGFEERTKDKGLIIRGWDPQGLILDHEAFGGFVTDCERNSLLKGLASGLPMVTWPVGAEQFYNEKLVTQVLKTGVSVGEKKMMQDLISRWDVESRLRDVMVGEERRKRAKELAESAKDKVKEGGSSDLELNRLMEDLMLVRLQNQKKLKEVA